MTSALGKIVCDIRKAGIAFVVMLMLAALFAALTNMAALAHPRHSHVAKPVTVVKHTKISPTVKQNKKANNQAAAEIYSVNCDEVIHSQTTSSTGDCCCGLAHFHAALPVYAVAMDRRDFTRDPIYLESYSSHSAHLSGLLRPPQVYPATL